MAFVLKDKALMSRKGLAIAKLSEIPDDEFLKNEISAISQKPLGLVTQKYLQIKTKASKLISLILNETQRSIIEIIFKLLKEGKPIRLSI